MGAEFFRVQYAGKTAAEAFEKAREDAFYDYGHAGYTGTIAEKGDFAEVEVPTGLTAREFVGLIESYRPGYDHTKEYFDPETPSTAMDAVRRAGEIADDKWGPALALQIKPGVWTFMGYASS